MGIFKRTKGGWSNRDKNSRGTNPILLEKLEPRILLSVDGLLNIATDPLEDPLLDNKPLVVQNAELLDTNTLADEQVPSELSKDNIYEPLLTLTVEQAEDDGQIGDNAEIADTDILSDDLDITLQDSQLLAVENYADPENITNDSEESSSDLTVSIGYDDTTDQLTETLLAANPPPAGNSIVIAEDEILSGNGVYSGDLINYGTISPGNSPGTITIDGDLTIVGSGNTFEPPVAGEDPIGKVQIEIAGNGGIPGTDFDHIHVEGVEGNVTLGGTLEIVLLDDFIPEEGDTFDFLTFTGSLDGAFDNATGLFGFGDGSLFFDVEVLSDRVRLVVKEAPGAGNIVSSTPVINDILGLFYSDYFTIDSPITVAGELTIDDFVVLSGSFSFGVDTETVTVKTGFPADITDPFGFGSTITDVGMLTLTIGAADVHAFVGLNGPYWEEDLDGDGEISWALPDGTTLTNSDGTPQPTVEVDGIQYGDIDGDGFVDADETAELSEDAIGLAVSDLDIGFVLMKPCPLALDDPAALLLAAHPYSLFYSLKATADDFEFVGWDEIILSALQIEINVNSGVPWPLGLGTPVVDFATSYPGDPAGFEVSTGDEPVYIDFSSKKIGFSSERITVQLSQFVYITGSFAFEKGPATSVDIATGLPSSLLGLLEEVLNDATGTDLGTQIRDFATVIPDVHVSTFQIGASNVHAFVGLNGPYWVDDLDGDGEISWALPDGTTLTNSDGTPQPTVEVDGIQYGDIDGDGVVDANETAELSEEAVGLVVNDLDIGFVAMAPTIGSFAQSFLGIPKESLKGIIPKFTALKATADSVEFVGFEEVQFSLEGITINYNNGTEWLGGLGPPVVDFTKSFESSPDALDGYFEVQTGDPDNPVRIDFDGNQRIGAMVEKVTLQISEFVHVTGSVAFEMGPVQTVDVTGGLLSGFTEEAIALLETLGLPTDIDEFPGNIPAGGAESTELSFMTVGASNVHAFVGLDGPYWVEDLDGDGTISWSFNTGDGNEASRTITSGSVTIDGTPYSVGDVLPPDTVVTLSGSELVTANGVEYGDIDGDGVVDANETAELSEKAAGIVINDFDFGMAIMTPTNPLDFARYFALRATAMEVALVGIEDVTLEATHLLVEVNLSSPSVYGLPLFPVIDFANTDQFASEQLTLFDTNDDGVITMGELATLNSIHGADFESLNSIDLDDSTPVDHEALLEILNTEDTGDSRGVIDIDEAAALLGGTEAAVTAALDADVDGDGKIDPLGYEVLTGGVPVYLTMDSSLIRAQGFLELNIFDALYLTGSIAFELGPTQQVTLTNDDTIDVTTMTIGAADVTAFVGAYGPYWTDDDGDHEPSPDELNPDSIGFEITDLDVGIMIMASTVPEDLGVYLAAKASVESIGLVGIDFLEAEGKFDIALNVGLGMSGLAVVDFARSFPSEQLALFNFDGDPDGEITVGELRVLHGDLATDPTSFSTTVGELYATTALETDIVSLDRVVEVLDTDEDGILTVDEAAVLAGTAAQDADADGDGKIDQFGYEVNTGDPDSPVILDFYQFLISFQLGGKVTVFSGSEPVFRLNGLLLFEVDNTGLSAFVAAGLEFGPDDIGADSSEKIYEMNALGGLVINADGIAADIDISVSVGGALSSVLAYNASARLMFNTTGDDQEITIPQRYVEFLDGTVDLEGSVIGAELHDLGMSNTIKLSDLTGPLDVERFTINDDSSATYMIPGHVTWFDGTESSGPYFFVSLHGDLTIAGEFVITADFQLKISNAGLELGFNGELDLGGLASVAVEGGAVIEEGVFAAYVELAVDIDVGGLIISGTSVLEINTGSGLKEVYDATGTPHPIPANTYKVTIDATIDFFGVLDATGSVEIGVEDGIFSIEVDASMDFFGIAVIDISGFINSNGSFSLSGNLDLDLTYGGFGIDGGIGVTLKDTGISGHGSVGLVLFDQSINIASASFNFNWQEGIYRIRAEGPLGIWLEVKVDVNDWSNWSIIGGLGLFDDIVDALGDAAEAVGEAVAEAAEAVADAFVDLGEAILDFGEDVFEFCEGFFTDIGELFLDAWNAFTSLFDGSRTRVIAIDISEYYSYTWNLSSDGTLTITNSSASKLCLAIVNDDGTDKLVVDAPDVTQYVPIAKRIYEERDWIWWRFWDPWSDWYVTGWNYIYDYVTFSNMEDFDASSISKIVIHGTNSSETIILDRNSISINTDVYGYGGDDVIVTGQGNDRVWGGNGDDTILTYEGDDELYGESDDDKLMGGTGNDVAYGGSGEDLLDESYGRASPDTIISETNALYGGPENDIILGSPGNDTIEGGAGEDLLIGDGGLVTLGAGSGGNDIIDGGADDDTLFGLKGDDSLLGGGGDDDLYGDEGDDCLEGGSGNDWLFGGAGNDILDGGADNDTLYGQKGEDILLGGNGDDFLYGDTDEFGTETARNILLGDGGVITIVDGLVTEISTTGQEAGGTDTIYGNGGADIVMGGAALDMIYGDAGDDILLGDTGIIMLVNGSLVSVDTEGEEFGGSDTIQGDMGDDIIIGGLNSSSDTLYGSAGDDIILGDNGFLDFDIDGDPLTLDLIRSATDGLGGGDYIYGNAGEDVLIGGTGGDSIDGNEGKDLILGDNGELTYTGDTSNPRFRVLEGTVIYGETPEVNDGLPLIDRDQQFNDPAGIPQWANWEVTLSFNSGGADYIAGGPDNDQIFGQGGNDIIQGDGTIGTIDTPTAVNAYRDPDSLLVVSASVEDPSDGDDYIEGNDGNDVIFGNLGQDDIIGGSSELFGLDTAVERTDGEDMIFGGAGTELMRNETGNILDEGDSSHGRDSDMILGDNGNIFRIIGTDGFNYGDSYDEAIVVRAAELLDYTPGGMDYDEVNAAYDIGAPDEIHGESGDDFLYGMKGNDVIFGEGQDDDIIGGYGNDWISGGTGDDGVLGDDGRIYTSRNGITEPLYGIGDLAGELDKDISTKDKKQKATINVSGELKKTVNLTPFKLGDPEVPQYLDEFDPQYADDIIFGGLGKDFLHGGDGDDAISGAEALTEYYDKPVNEGDVLKYGVYREGEFGAYNNDDPLSKVYWNPDTGEFVTDGTVEFLLNFDHTEGPSAGAVNTDGDDVIFGDLGNDWLVGGTGRDHLYGGRGSDLLNADDNLDTAGGVNNEPDDSETSYEDIAYGGAGADVLIANIISDRLIDWVGDFNTYVTPYTSFGASIISKKPKPELIRFLYDLSRADGADQTLGYSGDPRNGEPNGELGLVTNKDPDWEDQQTPK